MKETGQYHGEKKLNKMEVRDIPDKQFKIMVIKDAP